jgi:hypothetical protein
MANVELRIKTSLFAVVVKATISEMFHSFLTSKLGGFLPHLARYR